MSEHTTVEVHGLGAAMVIEVTTSGPRGPQGLPGEAGPPGDKLVTYPAAHAISGHRLVIVDVAGAVTYADAATLEHLHRVVGMTTGAASAGAQVTVQRYGECTEPSWSWTPDVPVYLGAAGALTQTPPARPAAQFSLVVGVAMSSTTLFMALREPLVLA